MVVDPLLLLQQMEIEVIAEIVSRLNNFGIVSDEDSYGLHSTVIEKWKAECDGYLIEHGYTGGAIEKVGAYLQLVGGVYAIYNSELVSYEQAEKYILSFGSDEI